METVRDDDAAVDAIMTRASNFLRQQLAENHRKTDRIFAVLMMAQWAFGILLALVVSPYGWAGKTNAMNIHVPIAVLLGGVLSGVPIALAYMTPGSTLTRHVIAASQMLWSALLIHLTGGRIETHFHVFGSLGFLSYYRDWKVLITATVVVAADHFVRGLLWPESVYGILNPEWWRFLEHAGWVVFADSFLILACLRGVKETEGLAERQAQIEALSESAWKNFSVVDRGAVVATA
jgi:hypothetical protein